MKYRWNLEDTFNKHSDEFRENLDEFRQFSDKSRQHLETKSRQNLHKIKTKFRENLELVLDRNTLKQFRQI